MYERRSIFRDPKKQILLAVLLAVIIFIILLGRQGIASHVFVDGDHAYVAVGPHGGVRILDISSPTTPVEIGYYDSPGAALRVSKAGNHLFVADGPRGLRVVEISDPNMPVVIGVLETSGSVQDVVLSDTYAYLALGEAGMAVVDVSNPTRPTRIARFDTPGFAQRLALVGGQEAAGIRSPYVYLADGRGGMHVVDVRLPISPRIVTTYDPQTEVRDIAISGPFAVLAVGRGGVHLLNIVEPELPMDYRSIDTTGDAQSVAIEGSFVYVADGAGGVILIDFTNPTNPNIVSAYQTPGIARMVTVAGGHVFIADDNQGLRILDRANPFDPDRTGLYETPGEASIRQVLGGLISIGTGRWANVTGKVWGTIGLILFDIFLFFVVLLLWLFVFGQFVMPVRTLTERVQVTERLINYFTGSHGPAVFIRNGDIKEGAHEKHRRGPGVALVDTASGAVIRNAHAFTRAVGPGVVFTNRNEFFEGAVDLHRQSKKIGPHEGEDPFAPPMDDETPEAYEMRQKRRYQTSALTRDGVEVVPDILVFFKLISEPGQGNTRFGFNPASVWNAISHEGINPDAIEDVSQHHVPWDWLPVHIAADLWREYLRKYTLDELFAFTTNKESDNTPRRTAFNTILALIRARMTKPEVEERDETGSPIERFKPSKEYFLLRKRGIFMIGVSIQNLRFPDKVEEQLLDQWKATWLQRAQEERMEVNGVDNQEKINGQGQAVDTYAKAVSQPLVKRLAERPKNTVNIPETLKELVQGTLRLTNRDPYLKNRISSQRAGLVSLIEWIRKQ